MTNWAVDQATASDVAERQRRFRAGVDIAGRLIAGDPGLSAGAARKEAARLLRKPEVLESLRSLWRTADMAAASAVALLPMVGVGIGKPVSKVKGRKAAGRGRGKG